MNAINWSKLYPKYKGQWIALKDDEVTVITSSIKVKDVIEVAKEKGYDSPILAKVPFTLVDFIGQI